MKFYTLLLLTALIFGLSSCSKIKQKAKDTINSSGEAVGQTASEFVDGVAEGVEKTLERKIIISDTLSHLGLQIGKSNIENINGGDNNLLIVYVIFTQDFEEEIRVTAFDKTGQEIGRSNGKVTGKKDEATYWEFSFNNRTYIEVKSEIKFDLN